MNITYTYHITRLPTISSPETDTVEYVEAYLHGIDENGKNTTQPFTFKPEIPESYVSGNFINYNDLTEKHDSIKTPKTMPWALLITNRRELITLFQIC